MSYVHHAILALLFAVTGCCVGSFLNVCGYRIPRRLSLLRPGSLCPCCHVRIHAFDNVPVLSWLHLRGRCRACGSAIPPRYFVVELGTGLSFAAVYLAAVALASGDLWEKRGPAAVLSGLLICWIAISVIVTATLVVRGAKSKLNELA